MNGYMNATEILNLIEAELAAEVADGGTATPADILGMIREIRHQEGS